MSKNQNLRSSRGQRTLADLTPYYTRTHGSAYLGNSLDLLKYIPDSSVNLVLTSPPFALTRKKEYGNESSEDYIAWFLPFAQEIKRILTDDGSFVLDLGGAYLPGYPIRSIYQYELLVSLNHALKFHLAQDFFHYNPSRLPAPAEWVNVRRMRVKDSVNVVWWLSKTEYPKADNRKVLQPYSESMLQLLKNGYKPRLRPSGHDISGKFQRDNNGAIPPNLLRPTPAETEAEEEVDTKLDNLLELANTESNSAYLRRCKAAGIKPHPARFPQSFATFFINLLTDEGDTVLDPFAGSNTTGFVAEQLRRKWIVFELLEEYLKGSLLRFEEPPTPPKQEQGEGTDNTPLVTEGLWACNG